MNEAPKPISVAILDKEYLVACGENERESLFQAVEFLNKRMKQLRDSGKIIGAERIAVMAALNIAHEYQDYRNQKEGYTLNIGASLKRIQSKIAGALSRGEQLELTDVSSS
ncbi:MAG: cell division protein ZapA [Chromatiales bacterium]